MLEPRRRHKYRNLLCVRGQTLIRQAQLLLQRLWHLWRRWAGEAEVDLDRVIDEPLQGGQSSDHNDTGNQTLPDTCRHKHSGLLH